MNRSPFAGDGTRPVLLAHRGIAQTFSLAGVERDTCTATRIHPPTHDLLENTLDSMAAAVAVGADIIEIDVHPTTDGHFAVFHDWTLDCRTNGHGRTRDHTLAQLQALDIGYGYTADGGASWPFRGKAVGKMPSLTQVLARFPELPIVINIKSNDDAEGTQLAAFFNKLPPERRARLAVYGGERPIAAIREQAPDVLAMSRPQLKQCLLRYAATGWTGYVPKACRHTLITVPINVASWLWGWPDAFVRRMVAAGSAVFVLGDYSGGAAASLDTEAQLQRLPTDYSGGIWTDEIAAIAGALHRLAPRSVPP